MFVLGSVMGLYEKPIYRFYWKYVYTSLVRVSKQILYGSKFLVVSVECCPHSLIAVCRSGETDEVKVNLQSHSTTTCLTNRRITMIFN